MGVIDPLEFDDGRLRCLESGVHYEHLVDLETGEVMEFCHVKLETLRERITREMGHKPVDHRLKSFGCKLESCPLLAKSIRHKTLAFWRLVAFLVCGSFDLCLV